MGVSGIDAASYQQPQLDMRGLSFGIVKATEGTTYTNPKHAAQVASVRAAKAVVGHYHFLHGGNIAAQAAYFLAHADWHAGDILACDWETPAAGGAIASDAEKGAFLAAVKKARPSARVILYCNRDYWLNRDQHSVCGDGLWIADPNSPAGHPKIQHAWTFHQYGERQGTDLNIGNFASLAALQHWAGVPVAAPPVIAHQPPAVPAGPTLEQRVATLESKVTVLEKKEGI